MAEKIKIPNDLKDFAKVDLKKFKKREGDYYDNKKDLKRGYYDYLIERLPVTIDFLVKFGYLKEVTEYRDAAFDRFTDEGFIKAIKKELKDGNKIENIKLFPILVGEIMQILNTQKEAILASNPNSEVYDGADLAELVKVISKKKLKKFEKAGIDPAIALDCIMIIPDDEALGRSAPHRFACFCRTLQNHANTKSIDFEKIVDILIDKKYYPALVRFVLLERKEVFGRLTDKQKEYYLNVSTWAFKTFENLDGKAINAVIDTYISARKRDDSQGKDAPRRYALTALSAEDYPRLAKAVAKRIAENDADKKYLG